MSAPPSDRQARVLEIVVEAVRVSGRAPSMREVSEAFGDVSPQGARTHVNALIRKGYLARDPDGGIAVLKAETAGAAGTADAPAGPPEDEVARGLTLPEAAARARFALRRRGERGWASVLPDRDGRQATLSISPADATAHDWEAW